MPRANINTNFAYLEVGFKAQRELPADQLEPFLKSLLDQNFRARSTEQYTVASLAYLRRWQDCLRLYDEFHYLLPDDFGIEVSAKQHFMDAALSWQKNTPAAFRMRAEIWFQNYGKSSAPTAIAPIPLAKPKLCPCGSGCFLDDDEPSVILCVNCRYQQFISTFKASASMRKAQEMWDKYRKFVRARCRAEMRKYTESGEVNEAQLDDMEMAVWKQVAAKIDQYKDRGLKHGPLAWLKTVIFSVVNNYYRDSWRQCRDIRKETSLPSADLLTTGTYAKPIRPKGASIDADEVNLEQTWRDACFR